MALRPQFKHGGKIQSAADLIRQSRQGVALTGAGFSTPSGIPDFRSPNSGIWKNVDPMETGSLWAFRQNPEKVYHWLRPLAKKIVDAVPNPAHEALSRLGATGHFRTVVTQNIDGLHQRAGSKTVLEVHGTMSTMTCTRCFTQHGAEPFILPYVYEGILPKCRSCGHVLKPDVIFFGEQLPYQTWSKTEEAFSKADLLLVAGSSLVVMPVAGLPMKAVEKKIPIIIVNKTPTYLDPRADVVIHGDVADVIPQITREVLGDE